MTVSTAHTDRWGRRYDGRKIARRIDETFARHQARGLSAMDAALATIAEEFDGSNRLPCGCAKDGSYICLEHWRRLRADIEAMGAAQHALPEVVQMDAAE